MSSNEQEQQVDTPKFLTRATRSVSFHRANHFTHSSSCIVNNANYNKGTAFTSNERNHLKLRGLFPAKVETLDEQAARVVSQLKKFDEDINRFIFLNQLKENNATLFYHVLTHNLQLMVPLVYTPTIGQACLKFGNIWRIAQGMYFNLEDKGMIYDLLDNWGEDVVEMIVVTDGSRILGLGDLGANGMGIPIGKLSLYVAGAGIHPTRTLPVTLDVGTNNQKLLDDDEYLGMRQNRCDDETYYEFVDEFLMAAVKKWPDVLIQFEDFSNNHCFKLLDDYREKILCFNDDIQGTGAVILSGMINAIRLSGIAPGDHRFVFLGAGSAGMGVATQIVTWLEATGIAHEDAIAQFYFVDSKGLITENRGDALNEYKTMFARKDNGDVQLKELKEIVEYAKPTGLIGLSGQGGAFKQETVEVLLEYSERPIVFALSNPTSKAEVTFENALNWTKGQCIFASGSPFDPIEYEGTTVVPGQGNNMFIFPGLGLGAIVGKCSKVTDKMISAAAMTLADMVTDEELAQTNIYPNLENIRQISKDIAVAVVKTAIQEGVSFFEEEPEDIMYLVEAHMYNPEYLEATPY